MEAQSRSSVWATGFAMFSMFFGAGNVVFPLAVGQIAQNQTPIAILGLMISAIGVPFLGLISMTLFNGNYHLFFKRIGKVPGYLVSLFILCLIGPFGAMPRLLTLSHSTFDLAIPGVPLWLFSVIACVVVYLMTFKKNRILDVLGYVLTPLLLVTLVIIIVKGIYGAEPAPLSNMTSGTAFLFGLQTGYETMDLLGAFYFSTVILACLESSEISHGHTKNFRNVIFMTLKSSIIGASLLALVYFGFCFVASFNSASLEGLSRDQFLGAIAIHTLGAYAGIVAIGAVSLACLTTAIALAAVFSEFLHQDIFREKISFSNSLVVTLALTFAVSTLGFTGIAAFLAPILVVCYPALIVLSILNIGHKMFHFNSVKAPVAVTFIISLLLYVNS